MPDVVPVAGQRVPPRCPHFGVCGGCSIQDVAPDAQIAAKQERLRQAFGAHDSLSPERWFPALTGPLWNYRRKARLSVRYVFKKERVLVGFRERQGRYVADMSECHTLDSRIAAYLSELPGLMRSLEVYRRIPQIEVACGDECASLIIRHLDPMAETDQERLRDFARNTGIAIFLQPAGIHSIKLLEPQEVELSYALPAHAVSIRFLPADFVQVNAEMNRLMVDRALSLLQLDLNDRVLDLFCGLGNFTLPMARYALQVTGIEGDAGLVDRAQSNAEANAIDNARFYCADLKQDPVEAEWLKQDYDKALVDPPRSGAGELLPHISATGARRLVYVSCSPESLARDAATLQDDFGFTLKGAGVVDMFPHTDHVESIALFEREV